MKFLIDAQLPYSLKQIFISRGHDCIHTSDMQMGNETPDKIKIKGDLDKASGGVPIF